MPAHQVVLPLFDGVQPLDVTGPHEVLRGASALFAGRGEPDRGYDVTLVAREPGPVAAESGLHLVATHGLPETGPIGTLLVPGGSGSRRASADFVDWLRRAADRSQRVVSVCSGAFLLAAAGLLDGRRATTHWRHAAALAAAHPAVDVRADSIYERRLGRDHLDGSPLVDWVRAAHPGTAFTTSVCTGSLVLAAAGLLDGLTATTHWSVLDMLARFGAEPVTQRVVEHLPQRVITAAGVSAGIDMGIRLVELLVDGIAAQAAQVMVEYDPQPPFDAGHPSRVGDDVMDRVREFAAVRK